MCGLIPYALIFLLIDYLYLNGGEIYNYLYIPLLVAWTYIDEKPYNIMIINDIILVIIIGYILRSGYIYYPVIPLMLYLSYLVNNN